MLLDSLIGSRTRSEMLRMLFTKEHRRVYLQEMARTSGIKAPNLLREAKALAAEGLIVAEPDGNKVYYSANRAHPLHAALEALVEKSCDGVELLRSALADSEVQVAFVYGSRATGTARGDSDYDLFVVTNEGLRKVSACLATVKDKLGVEINPYVLTPDEFRRKVKSSDHFVSEVLKGGKIMLKGDLNELGTVESQRLA